MRTGPIVASMLGLTVSSHMSHDGFYGEDQSEVRKTGLERVIKPA